VLWHLYGLLDILDTTAGGLLVPKVSATVVSALALIWFIRYIRYRNLQFLNYVIIIKTNILLPQI
jgi:undecaprenyl pyrophosphate phosphatase UppP